MMDETVHRNHFITITKNQKRNQRGFMIEIWWSRAWWTHHVSPMIITCCQGEECLPWCYRMIYSTSHWSMCSMLPSLAPFGDSLSLGCAIGRDLSSLVDLFCAILWKIPRFYGPNSKSKSVHSGRNSYGLFKASGSGGWWILSRSRPILRSLEGFLRIPSESWRALYGFRLRFRLGFLRIT